VAEELTPYPREASAREEAAAPGEEAAVPYAGWWRRAGALLIDSLLVSVVVAAVIGIALAVALASDAIGGILLILAIVFAIAAPIFYSIYWIGKEPGQTVGKRVLGIRVRHAEQDRAIGYGASAGRYFITFAFGIFYIPLLLDYLWPLWDGRSQTLHDKVASSIVVRD
jgi:uncharacterized RDD family membrane protein YckC